MRAAVSGRLRAPDQRQAVHAIARFANTCDLVGMTADVLARAGRPFPREPLRTLDAIHLASVEVLGQPSASLSILTRDVRIQDNATSLGYTLA